MALMTVQDIVVAGLNPVYSAAANGDTFADDGRGRTFLHVKNGGGGSINVTIPAQVASVNVPGYGSLARADLVVAVAAGAERMIGPFAEIAFKNSSGLVTVNYSAVTSVTSAAIRVPG